MSTFFSKSKKNFFPKFFFFFFFFFFFYGLELPFSKVCFCMWGSIKHEILALTWKIFEKKTKKSAPEDVPVSGIEYSEISIYYS